MPNGKSSTLWIVNIISFILFTILCCTGLVNWLVLAKGYGSQGGFQLSLRHFFISFHEWTGLIFMVFITFHIALHWPYIKSNLKKYGIMK
jgi:hypothetical protein